MGELEVDLPFRVGRAILGTVVGFAGHAAALGVGFLAGWFARPSHGGGMEDLAAAVLGFLAAELVLALACLAGLVTLLRRGRRDVAVGLLSGWLLGAVAIGAYVRR